MKFKFNLYLSDFAASENSIPKQKYQGRRKNLEGRAGCARARVKIS